MQYRKFGKTNWNVSALGFGCMRFPTTDGNTWSGNIIEREAIGMIRYAIEQGVNYFDTAHVYHDGKSEVVLGKALKDGYREKVKVATKSPIWLIQKPDDFDSLLNEELKRLQTDQIDFYLFHGLTKQNLETFVLKSNVIEKAEAALKDGRIAHLGFSSHDECKDLKYVLDFYDGWTFCLIQHNYLDIENQAGTEGLRYAASKGLAVAIMEPLLGGRLANPPKPLQEIFDTQGKERAPYDWALQWLWNQPEVSVVLSGMNTMDQVKKNIQSANQSEINSFNSADLEFIKLVRNKYKERTIISCTNCGYCMPCPIGVNILKNFEYYNDGKIHNNIKYARNLFEIFVPLAERANACTQCGICEPLCPQNIAIGELMPKVYSVLAEGKGYEEVK